jgi:uncharacterized Ntn-hydrolase superfamily protein
MTFSIIGRCAETGQLGIAISSSSISVGARCPWVRAGVGAVATQNVTLPALGPRILDLFEDDGQLDPSAALERALEADGWSQYRQVTVIDSRGRTAFFTGKEALGLHHAEAGEQCVAAGNMLAGVQVIEAMVQTFEKTPGLLAERLLSSMRAAIAAGGEVWSFRRRSPRNDSSQVVQVMQSGAPFVGLHRVQQVRDTFLDTQTPVRTAHVRPYPSRRHQ